LSSLWTGTSYYDVAKTEGMCRVDDGLAAEVSRWAERHAAALGRASDPTTLSGIPLKAVFTPLDSSAAAPGGYLDRLGLPGEFPFTRGRSPEMYRGGPWVMGMYSGRASPAATNERIKRLLASGQAGFSIALDLPTQNGLDSDHPLSLGEVGKVGVPIDGLGDMIELLDGIALDHVSQIRTTANAIGPIAVALFVAAAEVGGYKPADFRVLLQNDVLKEYLARGTYIFPPRAGLEFSVDVIEYCARELPHWEPIEFCGYHIRDAGSSAVQELAIAMSNGREYIDAALARNLAIDDFGGSIFLFLSAHIDILEEVAKFRAARRLWASLMRDGYGSTSESTCAAKLFVYTLGSVQAAREPLNNIVRIAYQALAAALGGVQTLATSSYDEALQLPSDSAARIGLRTQQILAHETGITGTADPLGGSYAVEYLTDEIEQRTLAEMQRITEHGGAIGALESGWLRAQIDEQAYQGQLRIERGEQTVVGVNKFADDQAADGLGFCEAGLDFEAEQRERLARLRAGRDAGRVTDCLDEVAAAARRAQNTVPAIIAAVHAEATVGEICSALAMVWGRASSGPAAPVSPEEGILA
jgi:methylmalonyl-CoA mutase N-terminal domain/subunit